MKAMGLAALAATGAAAMAISAPAAAQDTQLSETQIELFAEMLMMGQACNEVMDFAVRDEELQDWMTARLSRESDDDLDRILSLRDTKIAEMRSRTQVVRDMQQGNRRRRATDDHNGYVFGRCNRMSTHSVSAPYFIRTRPDEQRRR